MANEEGLLAQVGGGAGHRPEGHRTYRDEGGDVRMNIGSSTMLKPSKMCTFVVKVTSTMVVPHRRGMAVCIAARPPNARGRGKYPALSGVACAGRTVADGQAGI